MNSSRISLGTKFLERLIRLMDLKSSFASVGIFAETRLRISDEDRFLESIEISHIFDKAVTASAFLHRRHGS